EPPAGLRRPLLFVPPKNDGGGSAAPGPYADTEGLMSTAMRFRNSYAASNEADRSISERFEGRRWRRVRGPTKVVEGFATESRCHHTDCGRSEIATRTAFDSSTALSRFSKPAA